MAVGAGSLGCAPQPVQGRVRLRSREGRRTRRCGVIGSPRQARLEASLEAIHRRPTRYAGLVDLLRKAKPKPKGGDLLANLAVESWPQDNDAEEAALRRALLDLEKLPVPAARKRLLDLEKDHQARRDWVWAKLGRAPLADALRHLKTLAEATDAPLKGATTDDIIRAYAAHGWSADLAVLDALAAVSTQDDRTAVSAAIRHVYTPWLRDLAEQFQDRVKQKPLPGREVARLMK